MENTTIVIETDISLITSLLKVIAMFQMHLFYNDYNEGGNVV